MEEVSKKSTEFFYPNKKQLLPLIEKYGIKPNKSRQFQRIVTAFMDSPTYLPWAIKCVYTKVCSYQKMEKIAEWAKSNQHLISSLAKQNIISYKTSNDIISLVNEMKVIGYFQPCKEAFLKFNTAQRQQLMEGYSLEYFIHHFNNGNVRQLVNMSNICTKFLALHETRQNTFIRKSSTLSSAYDIWTALDNFITMPFMGWSLPEVKEFIKDFCENSKIVNEGENCCVIEVGSFEDSKKLGKDTPWCICKKDGYHHWQSYVEKHNGIAKQYFFFDFSLDKNKDANACIGFTIHHKNTINDAHNNIGSGENVVPPSYKTIEKKNNTYYFDEVIEGKGLDYNIWASNSKEEIESSLNFIYDNDELIWQNGVVYALKGKKLDIHKSDFMELIYENNNLYLCKINDILAFKNAFPWVRNRTVGSNFEEGKPITYVLFDMNKSINDVNSIISWDVLINDYNSYSLYGYNSQNYYINIKNYVKKYNIDENLFIPNVEISDSMLFHKSLVDGDFDTVWNLLKTSKDLDVNVSFNERTPIFMLALEIKNFDLFKAVFEHPSFKVDNLSDYGETILADVIYAWSFYDDEVYLKQVIDYILSKDIDFNIKTATNDTMLLLASQDDATAWIVEELLKKPNIDITTVNELGEDALKAAIVTYQAYECAKMLLNAGAKPMDAETVKAIRDKLPVNEVVRSVNN